MDEYQSSVLQLITTQRVYDTFEPYKLPKEYEGTASAFIVDIDKGFVLTSAHVIKNAVKIYAKSSLTDEKLIVKVKSYCLERDVALLVLDSTSRKLLSSANNLILSKDYVKEGTAVIAVGYPLGGDLSAAYGYHLKHVDVVNEGTPEVLTWEEYPSYMMMDIILNSGNSGGPIFNNQGAVVGIVAGGHLLSKNVGYGVPTYSILSIYEGLIMYDGPFILPKFSFTYQKVNTDISEIYENEGILINEIKDNSNFVKVGLGPFGSIFDKAKKHDMITSVNFNNKEYKINNDGTIGNRTFKNLVTEIPLDSPVSLNIVRLGKKINYYMIESYFRPIKVFIKNKNYILVCSMCLMELNNEHIKEEPCWLLKDRKSVIVTHVFENSVLDGLNICERGSTLKYLNGKSIKTLEDVKKNLNNDVLTFEFEDGKIFVVKNDYKN